MTGESATAAEEPTAADAIIVLAGDPTSGELAAVTAVLAAAAVDAADERRHTDGKLFSAWNRGVGRLRPPMYPGLGAWRTHVG